MCFTLYNSSSHDIQSYSPTVASKKKTASSISSKRFNSQLRLLSWGQCHILFCPSNSVETQYYNAIKKDITGCLISHSSRSIDPGQLHKPLTLLFLTRCLKENCSKALGFISCDYIGFNMIDYNGSPSARVCSSALESSVWNTMRWLCKAPLKRQTTMEWPCQFVHFSCYPGSICAEAGQKTLQVSLKWKKNGLW